MTRPPPKSGPVAVVFRKGIADYRVAVDEIRKRVDRTLRFRFLSGTLDAKDRQRVAKKLKGMRPPVVILVGSRAAALQGSLPPTPSVRLFAPGGVSAKGAMSVPLPPASEKGLFALKTIHPAVKRVILVAGDPRSRFVAAVLRKAPTMGVSVLKVTGSSAGELVSGLLNVDFNATDAVFLVPDPGAITPLILKAVLRVQFLGRVPVLAFSRRHVAMGALLAPHLDPKSCGRAAAAMAARLLSETKPSAGVGRKRRRKTGRRRRRRRGKTTPVNESVSTPQPAVQTNWYYNPVTAKSLGISPKRFEALNASVVGAKQTRPRTGTSARK